MQPMQFSLPQLPLLERLQQSQVPAILTSARTNKGMLYCKKNKGMLSSTGILPPVISSTSEARFGA